MLSVANEGASLPIAWRLYAPEIWLDDLERRQKAAIPDEIVVQTKPQIAIDQIRAALAAQTPAGVVLADAGYGADGEFRRELSDLGLVYSVDGIDELRAVITEARRSPEEWDSFLECSNASSTTTTK